MNLYIVFPRDLGEDWVCYVFAETRNTARAMLVGFFDNSHKYVHFNARLVQKDVGGPAEVCYEDCERLAALGVEYRADIRKGCKQCH